MLQYPFGAPGVVVIPAVGVEVDSAVVEGLDRQVGREIHTLIPRISVGAITRWRNKPPFITQCDQVVWIKRFDIGASVGSPVRDDGAFTSTATRLIAKFPGEDGRTRLVAVDDKFDISFVGCLGFRISVEGGCGAAEGGGVGVYATEVVPIIEEREDEFEAVFFSLGDGVVEARDALEKELVGRHKRAVVPWWRRGAYQLQGPC